MKVSIITVVYNGEEYIKDCIDSVLSQTYEQIEYIIIDGSSTDRTLEFIKTYRDKIDVLISENDFGLYDAMNKGIALATGEIVGTLNADDLLADRDIIAQIVAQFKNDHVDAVYGNLNYVERSNTQKVLRTWVGTAYVRKNFEWGWMPAHPTVYLKRTLLNRFGNYNLQFGSAADYEFLLRIFYANKIKAVYLPQLVVKMRNGGISNSSLSNRIKAYINDYKALKVNQVPFPFAAVLIKKISKLSQYF